MDEVLGMLSFLQLVVYFPLIAVKFPATTSILYNQIISLVTFALIDTDSYFPVIFDLPESEPMSDSFDNFDYSTRIFLLNMGTLFLLGNVILLQFPVYYCARCNNKTCLGKKIQNYYGPSQFWGTPIDFVNSCYVELSFACIMNFYTLEWEGGSSVYGMYINNIYMFVSFLIVVGYPIWLYFFLSKHYYEFQFPYFANKYENAYGKIELYDNPSAIWHPILYLLRRLALAAICTCLLSYSTF